MPSGREYHTVQPFNPPSLDEDAVVRMRAPPEIADTGLEGNEADSSDEEDKMTNTVGAFPGSKSEYSGAGYY